MLKTIAKRSVAIVVGMTLALSSPVALNMLDSTDAFAWDGTDIINLDDGEDDATYTDSKEPANINTKNYMKSLKLKWDLKKNGKKLTVKRKTITVKARTGKVWIDDYKKKTLKNGKIQVTFKGHWYFKNNKFTKKQVHKIVTTSKKKYKCSNMNTAPFFAFVDYNTGTSLEKSNKYGVKVTYRYSDDWISICKDKHGHTAGSARYADITVKITYPKSYKGLCIGLGMTNKLVNPDRHSWVEPRTDDWYSQSGTDNLFLKGIRGQFGDTTFYKNGKNSTHWLRIK